MEKNIPFDDFCKFQATLGKMSLLLNGSIEIDLQSVSKFSSSGNKNKKASQRMRD
jgi:hypothetical protein